MMNGVARIISLHGRNAIVVMRFYYVIPEISLENQSRPMGLQTVANDATRKRDEVKFDGIGK
nr:MAG TPA: hypothetical protein [Caudoviricetes sp.]